MAPTDLSPFAHWTAERLTARQVVPHRNVTLTTLCEGCRLTTEIDVWKVGARLADEPLQRLRFRCGRCGVYPSTLKIGLRDSSTGVDLLTIPLKPACFDEGHQADQAAAIRRADTKWKSPGHR